MDLQTMYLPLNDAGPRLYLRHHESWRLDGPELFLKYLSYYLKKGTAPGDLPWLIRVWRKIYAEAKEEMESGDHAFLTEMRNRYW